MGKKLKKSDINSGSLIFDGNETVKSIITLIEYNKELFKKEKFEKCRKFTNKDTVKWIKINGFSYIEIKEIGRCFNLHPLVLEGIKTDQRPKIEEYNDCFFLVLKYFNKSDHGIITKQISFVMGEHFVITIQDEETDLFDSVEKQIKISESLIRNNGADFLLYFLLNAIMESNFIILEGIENKIGHIEKELAYKANEKTLISINELKRDIITLKKAIWPLKEMSSTLKNSNFFLISDSANLYLRDVYDHSNMVSEMLDTFRDTTSGMHDTYLSVMSNNLNDIVRVLTIISVIFVPLTFLTGFFGMNFQNLIPVFSVPSILALALFVMFIIPVVMVIYFKRKGWL